ncbi:sugar ABC transporter permease [Paenibacillus validus]|uniref:carbohydrate ABC transporter permease n=1 Tax=Paenibacillus validus TaxID=44253 RepID=UPI000FDB67F4|nr:sugar ABC transporter permease [Paenibacillus validus]MED4602814.1 sugar ABC transporter permease [Paenibacillus validus]MED4607344.1 sugar ABC transporter permease [Paenibacillus validus]
MIKNQESGRLKYLLFVPTMLVLISMTIVPFIFSLLTSLTNYKATEPERWSFVGLDNFVRALTDKDVQISFLNTVIYVGCAVFFEFILGILIALLMNRKMKGISVIRMLLLLPMMATPVAVGLMWRWLFNTDFGIFNYYLSAWFGITGPNWLGDHALAMPVVVLVDIWQWTPFMVLSLLAGLQSLPDDPVEAAWMDGASPLQLFWHVTLPQLRPVILVVLLIRMIDAFKSFDVVWTLTNGGPGLSTELLSLRVYRVAFKFWETGYASAISWLFLILVIVITSQFIRFLYRETSK